MFKQLLRTRTGHGADEGRLLGNLDAESLQGPFWSADTSSTARAADVSLTEPGLEPRSPCPGQWQAALCHSPAPCLPPLNAGALDHLPAEAPEGRGHHCKNPPKHQSLPAPWHFSLLQSRCMLVQDVACCGPRSRASHTTPELQGDQCGKHGIPTIVCKRAPSSPTHLGGQAGWRS